MSRQKKKRNFIKLNESSGIYTDMEVCAATMPSRGPVKMFRKDMPDFTVTAFFYPTTKHIEA